MLLTIDRYQVRAPSRALAEFHFRPDALRRLTPPPVHVQVQKVEPLAEGSLSAFTLWFGPIPLRWLARHVRVKHSDGFTDIQENGPFLHWEHTHSWRADGPDSTEMLEMIRYEHHPGLKGILTRLLFTPLALKTMFAYRRRVIRQVCENRKIIGKFLPQG